MIRAEWNALEVGDDVLLHDGSVYRSILDWQTHYFLAPGGTGGLFRLRRWMSTVVITKAAANPMKTNLRTPRTAINATLEDECGTTVEFVSMPVISSTASKNDEPYESWFEPSNCTNRYVDVARGTKTKSMKRPRNHFLVF